MGDDMIFPCVGEMDQQSPRCFLQEEIFSCLKPTSRKGAFIGEDINENTQFTLKKRPWYQRTRDAFPFVVVAHLPKGDRKVYLGDLLRYAERLKEDPELRLTLLDVTKEERRFLRSVLFDVHNFEVELHSGWVELMNRLENNYIPPPVTPSRAPPKKIKRARTVV